MIPELLVATEYDFSRLRGTRPVAAGQWDDVQQAIAQRIGAVVTLRFTLRDGRTFEAHDDAPGWDDLLEHAERALIGFPSAAELMDRVPASALAVTVYERRNH